MRREEKTTSEGVGVWMRDRQERNFLRLLRRDMKSKISVCVRVYVCRERDRKEVRENQKRTSKREREREIDR